MSRPRSFSWSDPIALAALVVSLISILISIWTSLEQKRQWRATSLGRIEVVDASFVYWRTLSEEELPRVQWGYNVNLMPLLEGNRVARLFGLPSRLIGFDPSNNRAYPEITALTRAEFDAKVRSASGLPRSLLPAKQFQLQFGFQNVGSTPVAGLRLAIDSRMPDTGQWNPGPWSQPADVGAGRTVFKLTELTAPIDAFLPDRLPFRLRLDYHDVEGTRVERQIPVYFHSQSGAFNFGE